MSIENIKEYARRCASEPELREKAAAIGDDFPAHMRLAGSLGLPWTMADATAFRREMVDASDEISDLSEDDLEEIAGGFVSSTAVIAGISSSVTSISAAMASAGAGGTVTGQNSQTGMQPMTAAAAGGTS